MLKFDRAIILICAISFVESLSYSIVLPLIPYVSQQFEANELVIGLIFAVYSICQIITAPLIGTTSDHFGRKPLLILSQAATVLGFLILGLSNSLSLIFLSRVIDGLSAGNVSLLYTMVVDLRPPAERSRYFGLIATFSGLGILGGPWLGSFLGTQSLAWPSFVACGLGLVVLCLSIFFLPETRKPAASKAGYGFRFSQFGRILKDRAARNILGVILINNTIFNAFLLSLPLFVQKGLDLGVKDIGGIITILFVVAAAFQLLALQKLLARLKDYRAAVVGFGFYLAGFVVLFFARELAGVLVAGSLVMGGLMILNPALSAILSNRARQSEEGALLGINQTVASAGQIAGPVLNTL